MATRAQLSINSYNKEDTTYAQKVLNQYGGYGLAVDGIYGSNTVSAVKKFQKANGLAVDGIVGEKTWAALKSYADSQSAAKKTTTTAQKTTATAQKTGTDSAGDPVSVYDESKDSEYLAALKKADAAQDKVSTIQNPFSQYESQLTELLNQQAGRSFSYDLASDPLYQQYKSQYTAQGRLAMLDTLGQAAALTGGYGSSYGQMAGQQAYGEYLSKLGQVVPELYELAYDRYTQQGEDLQSRYADLLSQAKLAYTDYETKVKTQQDLADSLYDQANQIYKNNYTAWYDSYKNTASAKKTAASTKSDLYDAIVKLITTTGYIPPTEQLTAAGMTTAVAKAYQQSYNKKNG